MPALVQLIDRLKAMHLTIPRYDSAALAATLTKALEETLSR